MRTSSEPAYSRPEVEPTCPNCGMYKEQWPEEEGYQLEGQEFCCRGCAMGTGCTCPDSGSPAGGPE